MELANKNPLPKGKFKRILLISLKSYWLQFSDKITDSDFWENISCLIFDVAAGIVMTAFIVIRFLLRFIMDTITVAMLYVVAITVINDYPINAANFYSFIYRTLPCAVAISLILIFKKIVLSYLY
jgi:hypothetical protein